MSGSFPTGKGERGGEESPVPSVKTFDRPAFAARNDASGKDGGKVNSNPTGTGERLKLWAGLRPRTEYSPDNGTMWDSLGYGALPPYGQDGDAAGGDTTDLGPTGTERGSAQGGCYDPPGPDNFTPKTRVPRRNV